ncbi:MAG: hypothetical protein ACJ8EW_17555 [Rhizobium sp.]|uniref:hypothetical protein n=1 Tax=Rhizobium TaxID=379 RepID=UPI001C950B8A|nr:hypothetical protein [Rhizobium leguminosarum]MBY5401318.1 hypothetical protein [Rhizobium leguminosarum]UWM81135.1 hypothetical protein N2A41_21135 [Rhizobium leguminosarum bv. viciae]
MDRAEAERTLRRLAELKKHQKPYEPVLRYRPTDSEQPNYKDLSNTEITVFESAVEILLSAGQNYLGTTFDHLRFDGWREANDLGLFDRLEITRAVHRFNLGFYERDIPGHDPETRLRRFRHIRSTYGPWADRPSVQNLHLISKVYTHPNASGALIQIAGGEREVYGAASVAIFLESRYQSAALIGLQCEFIKRRFNEPDAHQSTRYNVDRGGKEISGSIRRHGRDTFDDYDFEARIGDVVPHGLDIIKERFFPVFAEMRNFQRSI